MDFKEYWKKYYETELYFTREIAKIELDAWDKQVQAYLNGNKFAFKNRRESHER